MTATDKEKIRYLRGGGLGYKAIAATLELPVSTVKSFCLRSGLTAIVATADTLDACLQCGEPLGKRLPGAERKKFCSDSCRAKWWSRNADIISTREKDRRVCAHCSRVFYSRKPKKYCNTGCYVTARFGGQRRDARAI